MVATMVNPRDELAAYTPSDPILSDVLERAWLVLTDSAAMSEFDELHLFILNPETASPALLESTYFTQNCQARRDEMMIIVNEQFLLETEAAIRSFAQSDTLLGTPYLKSDSQLFGLISGIQLNPGTYLKRLRRRAERRTADPQMEERIRHELMLTLLFFLGHEFGHLVGNHGISQFSTFTDASLPLEDRIDSAVVKLCRHVDEFNHYEFGLDGFDHSTESGIEVRKNIDQYRAKDETRYQRQEAFFQNETDADEWGNRIIIEYLDALAETDKVESEQSLYLLIRGIFAASLYAWYRDLHIFGQKLGMGLGNNADMLTFTMMERRENYIHGASLFGELHRFTLLRAVLAMEKILRSQTDWFDLPVDERSIRCPHDDATLASDMRARRECWLAESLQHYYLLCIAMDTAIKIANVGAATGWIKDADRRRGTPQLFVMNFEPINAAVERLKEFA